MSNPQSYKEFVLVGNCANGCSTSEHFTLNEFAPQMPLPCKACAPRCGGSLTLHLCTQLSVETKWK
jgi:hypothetical protein